MSEFKGTPGKWIADKADIFSQGNIVGNLVCISPIETGSHQSAVYWEANAKLIAKAPDMLFILQHLLEEGNLLPHDNLYIKNLLNEIL